jgi:DNA-binding response OmpR family regulator
MNTIKILTVEDDQELREALTTALEQAHFTVLTATNGRDGVTLALAEHPDVILMDIMLPELNGHDAVAKIREDVWGQHAKVVFLTSQTEAENVVYAVRGGSDAYIVKPHATLAEIVQKVREVLHSRD